MVELTNVRAGAALPGCWRAKLGMGALGGAETAAGAVAGADKFFEIPALPLLLALANLDGTIGPLSKVAAPTPGRATFFCAAIGTTTTSLDSPAAMSVAHCFATSVTSPPLPPLAEPNLSLSCDKPSEGGGALSSEIRREAALDVAPFVLSASAGEEEDPCGSDA